jgi:hypothetical protein
MIDYLSSLSPAALPDGGAVAWPEPVDWHLVKRDDDSLARLRGAARVFEELTASAEEPEERRMLQAWHLACLANDPEKQGEARNFCRAILEADPTHYRAVMWAVARGTLTSDSALTVSTVAGVLWASLTLILPPLELDIRVSDYFGNNRAGRPS